MVIVKARKGESADSLIRKFSRKTFEEGIVQSIRDRQYYKPPSEVKKEKNKRRKK
jgi:small subunit ribosomal protein S21